MKAKENKVHLGFRGGLSLSSFDKHPAGYSKSDFAPPEMTMIMGAQRKGDRSNSLFNLELTYIDLQSQSLLLNLENYLHLGTENLSIILGGNLFVPIFQGNSKFDDTQYDHFSFGAYGGVDFSVGLFKLYFTIGGKQVFTSRLANFEGVETEIAHDMNMIYTAGGILNLGQVRLLSEFSVVDSGLTTVVSKEFFFRLPEEKVNRLTLGVGLENSQFDIWVKMNKLTNIDDQTAHYYNLPYFSNDYMLAEEALFGEMKWKF